MIKEVNSEGDERTELMTPAVRLLKLKLRRPGVALTALTHYSISVSV